MYWEFSNGPIYNNQFAEVTKIIAVAYDWKHAWDLFLRANFFNSYKNTNLYWGEELIAETFRTLKPKDDYDLYRIRVHGAAPEGLRKYIADYLKEGKSFLPRT